MKLTLVKPNIGRMEHSLYVDEGRMEPLQLGLLAGMLPDSVNVTLVDDRCEAIDYDAPTDLVAITVETFTARRAYEIGAEYRRRGVPVVLGGFHPTLIPEEALEHGDAIVCGDAEDVWREVLQDAANGTLQQRYDGSNGCPQPGAVPKRSLFEGKGYLPISLLQFGRGCPNGCSFCAISSFFRQRHHVRPVAEVVAEIEQLDRKLMFFVDDNIVADHAAAKELFRALIPLKIRWVSQGSIDMVYDRELMDLMVASGCLGNVIGFESINTASLDAMKKTPNLHDFDRYQKEIEVLKSYGLQTWAAFTVGHDHDTAESLWDLYDFAQGHKFTFAAFNILMPYPQTPLYEKLQQEDRLLYDGKWWLHPEYRFNHAAFRPARMSPDELTEVAFALRSKWNSFGTIWKRFFDPRTNLRNPYRMMIYWLYNPLFRREVFKKQSMRFGNS